MREQACNLYNMKGHTPYLCKRTEEVVAKDAAEESKELAKPATPAPRPRLLSFAKGSRNGAPYEVVMLSYSKHAIVPILLTL